MAKKKTMKTVLTFVQDETGSMSARADATESAFNEYFSTLKNDESISDVTVQVWQFSSCVGEDKVRPFYDGDLAAIPELKDYRPRGVTPLYDAVGTALQQAEAKEADRYLFIVQTDGLENDSKDFTREQVANMLSEKEKAKNWTLVFLGAGINEWSGEAQLIGVNHWSTISAGASPVATQDAYASAALSTSVFLSTTAAADKRLAAKAQSRMKKENTTK